MTIKITSDSTCDLSKELVAKYDIGIIPLYVVKDGVSLKDGLEITPEDIFAFTDSTGKLCTTAAVHGTRPHRHRGGSAGRAGACAR